MTPQQMDKWLSEEIVKADKLASHWTWRANFLRTAIYGLSHPGSMEAVEAKGLLDQLAQMDAPPADDKQEVS